MVLEQFLEAEWTRKHLLYVFFLGILYVFVGYFVSTLFFPGNESTSMLFLATLLLMPTLVKLLRKEEKIESKEGLKHFFINHKDIFDIYLVLFLGIFVGYMILGFGMSDLGGVFSYQTDFLESKGSLDLDVIKDFKSDGVSIGRMASIFLNNVTVVLICFILSVFYGAGAIFLIVFNASIFSAFLLHLFNLLNKNMGQMFSIFGLFLLHLIPELSGFMAAAIAGGVVSRALFSEHFGSKGFKNVLRDSSVILLIAIGLVLIGAILEVFVTGALVKGLL